VSDTPGKTEVEVLSWLSRATLDIIGLGGFNYSFDALKQGEEASELSSSFSEMFKSTQQTGLSQFFRVLKAFIPIFRCFVSVSIIPYLPFISSSSLLRRTS
jgi:hypothetical protein